MKSYNNRAWAEINLNSLEDNIKEINKLLFDNTELMAVVKANAYGHGEAEVCAKLEKLGVKYYGVSNLDEAVSVRRHINSGDILILGYTPPDYAHELCRYNIIQGVVSYEHAAKLAEKAEKPVRCHIKIDTGMGRIGLKSLSPLECAEEIIKIMQMEKLSAEGIYTHYAAADSEAEDDIRYTAMQTEFILAVYDELLHRNLHIRHVHFLNSAGLCYHNHPRSTIARAGIIMYGLSPNRDMPLPFKPKQVLEFKTVISQVKTVFKGDYISYGRTFQAPCEMKLATLTVGYADGYSRLLSSRGEALVCGKRCKIVGRICMDQLMLDVSDVPEVHAGDTAVLIGQSGDEKITADYLASLCGTIGYEIVCGISKRVPRIAVSDNINDL